MMITSNPGEVRPFLARLAERDIQLPAASAHAANRRGPKSTRTEAAGGAGPAHRLGAVGPAGVQAPRRGSRKPSLVGRQSAKSRLSATRPDAPAIAMTTKKSIAFCHGLWADGSCFVPTLSQPDRVLDVIRSAANA